MPFYISSYLKKYYKDMNSYVDVLIDGRYDENLRDISLHLRGSSNQRIFRTDNNKI